MNEKQTAFANHYVQTWNATQSAILAGYSEHSARSIGHELLTRPDISAFIKVSVDELAMSAEECLIALSDLSRSADRDRDKLTALALIAKVHAMLTDKLQIETIEGLVIEDR